VVRLRARYGAFATIIGPVFVPSEDPSTIMLAAFATYGTALIVRPVGALLFGGELGVAGVLIFERAPSGRRGELASWHTSTRSRLGLRHGCGIRLVAP
jgi:MFS family permease